MKKIKMTAVILLLAIKSYSQIPTFTVSQMGLPQNLDQANIAAADYDMDGYVDIFAKGRTPQGVDVAQMYKNQNGTGFSPVSVGTNMPGGYFSSGDWGDYDNDGDLDLIYNGYVSGFYFDAMIYNNNGGMFTYVPNTIPQGKCIRWCDLDNDGDLDVITTGNFIANTVYRNDGGGVFTNVPVSIPALDESYLALADYDNDGDKDLSIIGTNTLGVHTSAIYRNDGNFIFSLINVPSMPAGQQSTMDWGDFDNDGDLDLLVSVAALEVFRNDGNNVFTDMNFSLLPSQQTTVKFIDLDTDGDQDLFFSYWNGTQVYWNDSNTYSYLNNTVLLTSTYPSYDAFFDFDLDGDIDFVHSYLGLTVAENNTIPFVPANIAPSIPVGLTLVNQGSNAVFKWDRSTDDHTPSHSISYDVKIGTVAGSGNILSGIVGPNGPMKYEMGNAELDTFLILKNLPAGTYYWNVTAIDGSFKFSSSSSTVASAYTPTGIANDVTSAEIKISPNPFINNLTVYNTKENGEIWITDITGKNVWAQKSDPGKTQLTFDKSVTEGVYFLYYKLGNTTLTKKLVK